MIPLPTWLFVLLQIFNAIIESHRWIAHRRGIIGVWMIFLALLTWWVWFFGWHIQHLP